GRMAVDEHALARPAPQMRAGLANLLDDVGDAHLRTEIVADDRDRDAVGKKTAGDMAEGRGLERAPIAAVDDYGQRFARALGAEEIDELPGRRAVCDGELGAALRRHLVAEFLGRRAPALEDRGMLWHARAVVVLDLVVDVGGGHGTLPGRHPAAPARSAAPRRTAGHLLAYIARRRRSRLALF